MLSVFLYLSLTSYLETGKQAALIPTLFKNVAMASFGKLKGGSEDAFL